MSATASAATAVRAPGALPVLGHLGPFLASPLGFLRSLAALGDLVEVQLAHQRVLVVCEPTLTRELLTHDRAFDKGGPLYERMRELAGNGLATCPAADHRRQRRLIQPTFHRSRLPLYARTMTDRIEAGLTGWQPGQRIDLVAELRSMAADILLSTVFGAALKPQTCDSLAADLQEIMSAIPRRAVLPALLNNLPTPANLRYRKAHRRARGNMAELVRRLRTDPADGLFGALLGGYDPQAGDRPFTDTELVDQAVTMYAGGTETTVGAVCWALFQAARNPEAGQRLTEECRSALGSRAAEWDDLARLPYSRQVLLEAIRLNPPGWLVTRTATSDAQLGRHRIPAGTTLAYSPYLLGRLTDQYPNPDRFDPDRWSADGPGGRGPAAAFGGGARQCIGEEFSLAEGVLMLASVCARWQLRIPPDGLRQPRLPGLTLNPLHLYATVTPVSAPRP
ncbi:cytochrome P450 [Kitasatospora sp. NPDC089509]|uniref:cytochrome P450 n=1 Tax=Kitasatospora sp. NPDC089509 TaxID=3364079 RepID=UPI0038054384